MASFIPLLEQIKKLHRQKLKASVESLCNLVTPSLVTEQATLELAQVLYIYAKALYKMGYPSKAELLSDQFILIRKALLQKNADSGNKNKTNYTEADLPSEADALYIIHKCKCLSNDYAGAISILETIPAKNRTARINMALGNLYKESNLEKSAIAAFKEVIKVNPFALAAVEALISLGVKLQEIPLAQPKFVEKYPGLEWLCNWLNAQHSINHNANKDAIEHLKPLDQQLKHSGFPVLLKGKALYYDGNYKEAISCFNRFRALEPKLCTGLDMMAASMFRERLTEDFDKLMSSLDMCERALNPKISFHGQNIVPLYTNNYGEVWVAHGYYALFRGQPIRALHLADKAITLITRDNSCEALLLRATSLQIQKKTDQALASFRDVLSIQSHRYEAYAGILDCYVTMRRMREAYSHASSASKKLNNARAHTLYAQALFKESGFLPKVKNLLEKAISIDPHYLPAVVLYAELLEGENNNQAAISLLLKYINYEPHPKVYTLLGELYAKTDMQYDLALENFDMALHIDPKYRRALDGMSKIDNSSSSSSNTPGKSSSGFLSSPVDADEQADTSMDVAADDSDSEDEEADIDRPGEWPSTEIS